MTQARNMAVRLQSHARITPAIQPLPTLTDPKPYGTMLFVHFDWRSCHRVSALMRPPRLFFMVAFLLAVIAAPVAAQETVRWRDFQLCQDCPLRLTEVVRLGDAEGPGMITLASPMVSWSEDFGYLVAALTTIQRFDSDGRFVRAMGRAGEGPGEFRAVVDAHAVEGRIVGLDALKRAWVIFDAAGDFLAERRYGFMAGSFVPIGGNRVVVIAMDRRPSVVGNPLHLVDLDSGVPSLHFGAASANWTIRGYGASVIGSVLGRPGTLWWATVGSPRLQEWSVEDELLTVMEGELPWFPEVAGPTDPFTEPPPTLLQSIALDRRGHLWMALRTADPEWRDVELEAGPEAGAAIIPDGRSDDYRDSRLDIFDLDGRRHVGSYTWDLTGIRLMNLGGEPAIRVLEYTDDLVPQIVIYRVEWAF